MMMNDNGRGAGLKQSPAIANHPSCPTKILLDPVHESSGHVHAFRFIPTWYGALIGYPADNRYSLSPGPTPPAFQRGRVSPGGLWQ
jgi:hypothetical protein